MEKQTPTPSYTSLKFGDIEFTSVDPNENIYSLSNHLLEMLKNKTIREALKLDGNGTKPKPGYAA